MKQLVEFKLDDGEIIFVGETYGIQRVSAGQDGVEKAEKRFTEALARVRPGMGPERKGRSGNDC